MSGRTVPLSPTESMLVRLAVERKAQAVRIAEIELEQALSPLMAAHGKQPTERADIRDGSEPGTLVLVFTATE